MAQTWRCDQGDDNLSYVFETNVDTGEVSHPCIDHWLMRCVAVAESLGWTAPEPAADPEPASDRELETVSGLEESSEPATPDPMVTRVVRRGQTRGRSKAERGAMHAHLREAETGTDTG